MKLLDKVFYFAAVPVFSVLMYAWMFGEPSPDKPVEMSAEQISWARIDHLKNYVREDALVPGSVSFTREYYSDEASCVNFIAKNAFGAPMKGVASLYKGKVSYDARVFRKVCT